MSIEKISDFGFVLPNKLLLVVYQISHNQNTGPKRGTYPIPEGRNSGPFGDLGHAQHRLYQHGRALNEARSSRESRRRQSPHAADWRRVVEHRNRGVSRSGFDGGTLSSNGGVLILREIEKRLGLARVLSRHIPDDRDGRRGRLCAPTVTTDALALENAPCWRQLARMGIELIVLSGGNQAWPQETESHLRFATLAARGTD